MSDAELVKLLEAIKLLALVPYPFPDDTRVSRPELALALGQIAGIASKALAE